MFARQDSIERFEEIGRNHNISVLHARRCELFLWKLLHLLLYMVLLRSKVNLPRPHH
eukprot:UN27323